MIQNVNVLMSFPAFFLSVSPSQRQMFVLRYLKDTSLASCGFMRTGIAKITKMLP